MAWVAGRVTSVKFTSDSFCVCELRVAEAAPLASSLITVKGHFYGLLQVAHGMPIKVIGTWRTHPKYGRQFHVSSWEPWARNDNERVHFLSLCIQDFGIGPAQAVVQEYGSEVFEALTHKASEVLSKVKKDGIGPALLSWKVALSTRDVTVLLRSGGLKSAEVASAMARFGLEAGTVIKKNPYRLMEISGYDFSKVDLLAKYLGFDRNAPCRLEGLVLWALQAAALDGHLYLRRGDISQHVTELLDRNSTAGPDLDDCASDTYARVVAELEGRRVVVVDSGTGVYLPEFYEYERTSAKMFGELLKPSPIEVDLKPFLEEYERSNRITLSEAQREAVSSLAEHRVLVLTGLPGTGKTTALRALVRLFEEARTSFVLMAPTGVAAKRLAAVTGHPAATVHRTLRYDGSSWGHNQNNRFLVDAAIVDEVSMMDQELFYRLLSALRSDTMLVLVGDDAQLPSVGPGNVLQQLVSCRSVPHIKLTQIYRQDEKGDIVSNSHKINRGEMLDLPNPRLPSEFKLVRIRDEEKIADFIVQLATKLKSKDANFQVLSPKYAGEVGVDSLNERLRDALNPKGPPEWNGHGLNFRLGDRLMVVKNDYELDVYNGDVGKLVKIGSDHLLVRVHGEGVDSEVEFPIGSVPDKLRLAYCVTAHKSQGSEFDTIVMPVVRSQGRMLQRNLLYTAVTRAREHVWLVGEEAAVQRAIANDKVVRRNTVLAKTISSVVESLCP